MPLTTEISTKYFLEKDRKSSFKSWPFTERQACSITKVTNTSNLALTKKNYFYSHSINK